MHLLHILGWICWRLGHRGRRALAQVMGWILSAVALGRKQLTVQNLRRAFPNASPAELARRSRASFANLVLVFEELLATPFLTSDQLRSYFRFTNPELLRDALRRERGVILWSAHLANWEWSALVAALEFERPLLVVVKEQRNRVVNSWLDRVRRTTGNILVPMFRSARAMLEHLGQGGVVALLGDQAADPRSDPFVLLFGSPAATHKAPVLLARHSGAVLLFAYCLRTEDGCYEVFFEPVPGAHDESVPVEEVVAHYNRLLERAILRAPEQWVWQHNRWKYQPRTSQSSNHET
jgi:KDO2-lipid IV(A) lauroyltransferase